MDYEIYHLVYDLPGDSFQESIVSAFSSQGAERLLARHLTKEYIREEPPESFGFSVRDIKPTGVKASEERVFIPKSLSVLEMKIAILRTQCGR